MARYVSLEALAAEGHAETPFEMLRVAVNGGLALGLTGGGLLGVRESAADRLRQERREQEQRAEREAELQRIARQDEAVADLVQRAAEEETRRRVARLERDVGPVWAIAQAMEKERLQQPGVIHPIGQATDEFRGLGFSLDQIEAYAAREYGLDVSA